MIFILNLPMTIKNSYRYVYKAIIVCVISTIIYSSCTKPAAPPPNDDNGVIVEYLLLRRVSIYYFDKETKSKIVLCDHSSCKYHPDSVKLYSDIYNQYNFIPFTGFEISKSNNPTRIELTYIYRLGESDTNFLYKARFNGNYIVQLDSVEKDTIGIRKVTDHEINIYLNGVLYTTVPTAQYQFADMTIYK